MLVGRVSIGIVAMFSLSAEWCWVESFPALNSVMAFAHETGANRSTHLAGKRSTEQSADALATPEGEREEGNPLANVQLAAALIGSDVPDYRAAERAILAGAFLDMKVGGRPLLTMLVRKNNLEGVKFALKHGASLNSQTSYGRTPLHEAAMYGYEEIAAELLKRGANVNAVNLQGETPLFYATSPMKHLIGPPLTLGHQRVADLLRAHGGVIFEKQNTAK